MAIVGQHPDHGVRIVVERGSEAGPPWSYTGSAREDEASFLVTAVVDADGQVVVSLSSGAPAGLAERVRLIVKAAAKLARQEGLPPPRRIARWRADR